MTTPQQDFFSIKVSRLANPTLYSQLPQHSADEDPESSSSVSQHLLLPDATNSIFIGETLRACVSFSHASRFTVQDIGVKIEIQTTYNKFTLIDNTAAGARGRISLQPGEIQDLMVQHKVTDHGINSLVCSLVYTDETGLRKTSARTFKFAAEAPLEIRSMLLYPDRRANSAAALLAEVAVTNLLPRPLFIEQTKFVAVMGWASEDLSTPPAPSTTTTTTTTADKKDDDKSLPPLPESSEALGLIPMHGTRTYVFRVRETEQLSPLLAVSEVNVGYPIVTWRAGFGEWGTMQGRPLLKMGKPQAVQLGVDLVVVDAPADVKLEAPFTVELEAKNLTQRRLTFKLTLVKEKMGSLVPSGITVKPLSPIEPGTSLRIPVQLLPLGLGLQRLSGFRLTDVHSHVTGDWDNLHTVDVR